jgi:hypothetical protein
VITFERQQMLIDSDAQEGPFGEEGKRLLLHGMQNLVGALAEVMGGPGGRR